MTTRRSLTIWIGSSLLLLAVAATAQGQVAVGAGGKIQSVQPQTMRPVLQDNPRAAYVEFQQNVEKIIREGTAAARNQKERDDFVTLQFLSRDLAKQVDAGDWDRAKTIKERMNVSLQRAGVVMDDAPRRKAEEDRIQRARDRAQRERQHRERMLQEELHHRELIERFILPYWTH